jgi:hypothetical protein
VGTEGERRKRSDGQPPEWADGAYVARIDGLEIARFGTRAGWRQVSGGVCFEDADGERVLRVEAADRGALCVAAPLVRPDRIGREAELELRALGLSGVSSGGPTPGLDPSAFLQAWRVQNAVAIARTLRDGEPRRSLPAAIHERVWRWNRARDAYFDRLSAVEMVPCAPGAVRLVAPQHDPVTVLTAVSWSDGAPIALPEVDLVLAVDGADSVPRAIPLVALLPWLERFPRREAGYLFGRSGVVHDAGLAHWIVDDDLPAEELMAALRTLGAVRTLEVLAPGEVLDREQVEPVRAHPSDPGTLVPGSPGFRRGAPPPG